MPLTVFYSRWSGFDLSARPGADVLKLCEIGDALKVAEAGVLFHFNEALRLRLELGCRLGLRIGHGHCRRGVPHNCALADEFGQCLAELLLQGRVELDQVLASVLLRGLAECRCRLGARGVRVVECGQVT